ncbi:MAG: UDP-4-amino-4,6-dideoxy-N-acetyl-beta-L-altrosamine transaminase [Omnitrophica WOR_2 bacterium RIFCSPLOWO2_02_FULL_50_19]|nr:MAG: UDP-4-amino-4,6-dideoxy-N-acetyl-beta-L-altrosamine transaminase [Omnitrophica WOR_2 bacterium RIFCSPLOWO2_02_FULL_50_19]
MRTIPYGHQKIDKKDVEAVIRVLKSDRITQGPMIREFEEALCGYTGAKYAVCVSSGTAALHIACLAAGLKQADEIITSPITFVASANCAIYCGARPVFADVDPKTANIKPGEVLKTITKKTRIVIPVDFAGLPCDLEEVHEIAHRNNLIVIEDAAHALGAEYKGTQAGSCKYSDMAVFSFHPVKSITTGEGGAVLTNNKDLYKALMVFRNHGITKDPGSIDEKMKDCGWYYEMQKLGFNYRITDIQAALGLSQLKKADVFIEKRRKIAAIYNKAFNGNEYFDFPEENNKEKYSSYHLYPIILKDRFRNKRKEVFLKMRNSGLGVQVHYIPVYLQPYYQDLGFKKGLCPDAESYYEKEISIPIYPALKDADIKYVINIIFRVFREIDRS